MKAKLLFVSVIFRGRYASQCVTGEKVMLEGKRAAFYSTGSVFSLTPSSHLRFCKKHTNYISHFLFT